MKPESMMEKTLCAVDELVGFVAAVAYVRPSKNIADVQVSSVKKKWKDKAFAAGVHRDEIERAAADLGVPLDELIGTVLAALQANASALGLDGVALVTAPWTTNHPLPARASLSGVARPASPRLR